MKRGLILTFIVLILVGFSISLIVSHEKVSQETGGTCNTDKARESAKLFEYDLVDAYQFGLKIQHYVKSEDLQSLFGLVNGELSWGPRKKSIKGKSFSDFFSSKWREDVLSEKPPCSPYGWRGFFLGDNSVKIIYQQDYKTGQWNIITISDYLEFEPKNPSDGGWKYNGELLTRSCFTKMWMSGDNYEEYYEKNIKGDHWDEFAEHIGRYIGGPVTLKSIVPSWAKKGSNEKISLAIKLSECLQNKKLPKITLEDGWVSQNIMETQNECYKNSDYCLKERYGLIKRISLKNCQSLAPHFPENCIDLGLVQISDETGGSMGNDIRESIYGIVKDPASQEVYVVPLVNFSSINDALNFVDQLN